MIIQTKYILSLLPSVIGDIWVDRVMEMMSGYHRYDIYRYGPEVTSTATVEMRTLISYAIMRLIEPDNEWYLYIVDYKVRRRHRYSSVEVTMYNTLMCMDKNCNIVDTNNILYESDVTILKKEILTSSSQMYSVYDYIPCSLDLDVWVDYTQEDIRPYVEHSIPRSVIRSALENRPMEIPSSMNIDIASRIACIASNYTLFIIMNQMITYILPRGQKEIPTPRHGIRYRGDISFLFQ